MLKSLYSGVSGMKGFQTKLDVIGNNVANVNTVGFKKSRVMFQDIINQNIAGATAATNDRGGINPRQIGLGSKIASIDTVHTPGSPMTTNIGTDVAVDGDAYFVVSPENSGDKTYLTKAGNFTRDSNGNLVNANGYFVLGKNDSSAKPIPITITEDALNLDANGNPVVDATGKKVAPMKFTSYAIDANGYINVVREDGVSGKLARNTNGQYYLNTTANQANDIALGTAVVTNPSGLSKVGNTLFQATPNSGNAVVQKIEDNAGGQINSGMLEMSNVDLTEEFTEMIVAQRGFQANARTITTSDSILEEIINLKR